MYSFACPLVFFLFTRLSRRPPCFLCAALPLCFVLCVHLWAFYSVFLVCCSTSVFVCGSYFLSCPPPLYLSYTLSYTLVLLCAALPLCFIHCDHLWALCSVNPRPSCAALPLCFVLCACPPPSIFILYIVIYTCTFVFFGIPFLFFLPFSFFYGHWMQG